MAAAAAGAGAAGGAAAVNPAALAAAAAQRAAAIPSGAAAPFKLCKTVLTSFSAYEADPTYVLHLTVSATASTAAATPKPQAAAQAAAAAAASQAASPTTAVAAPAEPTCIIAAATSDHVVKLYEYGVQSGSLTLRHQLTGHKNTIHDVQFVSATNNALLCSASEDGSVVLWDARTGKAAAPAFRHPTDTAAPFFSCTVSGTLLAAGTTNACVLWDIRSGKALHTLDFHTEDVTQVRFHPVQPNTLLTGSVDGTISVCDLSKITSGEDGTDDALDFTLTPDQPVARMGFFGPRSEFLYALSTVETLTLWNLQSGDLISDFKDIRQTLSAASGSDISYLVDCVYEPASQRLYLGAGTVDGALLLTHVNTAALQPVCRLEGAHNTIVRDLLWVGQTIVTGGQDARLCSWTTAGDTAAAGANGAAATAAAGLGAADFKAATAQANGGFAAAPSKGLVFSTPIGTPQAGVAAAGAGAAAGAADAAPMDDGGLGAVRTKPKTKGKDKKFNPYAR